MIRKFISLFLAVTSVCFAREGFDKQRIAEKTEFFYLNQELDDAGAIVKDLSYVNELDDFFFFFIALARVYPQQIMKWLMEAQFNFEKHPNVIQALRFGGLNGEAISLAQKAGWPAKQLMSLSIVAPLPLQLPIDMPGYISCMSAHFGVTGDPRYGKKIIDIFEAKHKDQNFLVPLQAEAKNTLRQLLYWHDGIYRLCLEEAEARTGKAKAILKELIEERHTVHKESSFSEQNGLLTAQIFITDDLGFEEEWNSLPMEGGPVCKQLSSIPYPKENKLILIYIMLNGFELTKDLGVHLTYDMEIIDPKGNQMNEFKNLSALKRKLPNRFLLQKAGQPVVIEFCIIDEDSEECLLPGNYTVKAVLKDHVSGKILNLHSTFEVLPEK